MNIINSIKRSLWAFGAMSLVLSVASCDDDKDEYVLSGLEASELSAHTGVLELNVDDINEMALILTYDQSSNVVLTGVEGTLAESSVGVYTIEFSNSSDFENVYSDESDKTVVPYTVVKLNIICNALDMNVGEKQSLFVRLVSQYGVNTEAKYSNVLEFEVTPFYIDMTKGQLLDKDKIETGVYLYSPQEDGEYYGFVGCSAWYNFYFQTGDYTLWGSKSDWTAFSMYPTGLNTWFPGPEGCYYAKLSTKSYEWSATYIPTLESEEVTLSTVKYNRKVNQWTVVLTTTTANQSFSLKCDSALLYNMNTGTDDAAAKVTAVSFGSSADGVASFNSSDGGQFTAPGDAGTYTLVLDLNDFNNLKYSIVEGEVVIEEEEELPEQLYVLGLNDLYDFSVILPLTSEEDTLYSGIFVSETCSWGYYFGTEVDNWTDLYKLSSDSVLELNSNGTALTLPGEDAAGTFYAEVSLKSTTSYSVREISEIYLAGLDDEWTFMKPLTQTEPGVFSGSYSYEKGICTYGIFCYAFADDWDTQIGNGCKIGGGNYDISSLGLEAGKTYTFTFNLNDGTISIVEATTAD